MGRLKALLPWPPADTPFVLHVTNTLRDAGCDPVGVVTGAHHDVLALVLDSSDIPALFNARHREGQLSSLQRGLEWAFSSTPGNWALVTLVDVPAVSIETVRTLITASRHTTARAVRPALGDRHGHPVLWRRDVLPLLLAADATRGAKAVMHELAGCGAVLDVPVADPGVLIDIDTEAEYLAQLDDIRRQG